MRVRPARAWNIRLKTRGLLCSKLWGVARGFGAEKKKWQDHRFADLFRTLDLLGVKHQVNWFETRIHSSQVRDGKLNLLHG